MELEHVFDYTALLKAPLPIGGPYGERIFYEVRGGRVEGPRLSGELVGGGGDWALVGPDGWARLDVRGQIRTDDGALIYTSYDGLIELNPSSPDEQYFRTTPRFETGDDRYRWLTQSVFVARGRQREDGVAYEVCRVG